MSSKFSTPCPTTADTRLGQRRDGVFCAIIRRSSARKILNFIIAKPPAPRRSRFPRLWHKEWMMLRKLRSEAPVSPLRTTALVTGGAGFIGSHLCDRLIQSGYHVICLDNLYTGSVENIRPLVNHPAFTFIEHDVTEPLTISGPVQRIYNLACPASPPHYQRDPIGTMRTCVLGAYNVLELANEKGARILQASTSEVYGDPEVHPQPETYVGHVNTIGPRACYDEGKRAAEALFFDYHRMHSVQIKIARIFNTYGPRMMENDGRVVSNFIVQALRGEPITVYGKGT